MRFSVFTFLSTFIASTAAAVPLQLSHQGRLLDSSDVPLTGTQSVTFTLWDADTGSNALWSDELSVTFDNGYFSAILGGTSNPVDENVLDNAEVWLSLTIDGEELLPRHRVSSTPYAVMAGTAENATTLGGNAPGDYRLAADNVDWSELDNVPADADTLAGLTCSAGDRVSWIGTGFDCVAPSTEVDPGIGTLTAGSWCITDGSVVNCDQAAPLTSESDPGFTASPAAGITAGNIANWGTAYGWGNHSAAGYLSAETDPQVGAPTAGQWCRGNGSRVECDQAPPLTSESDPGFTASPAAGITAGNIANWGTAYGWGNHAAAGYLSAETDPQVGAPTAGQWCRGNGSRVECDQAPPLTAETDPQVATVSSGRWCVGNAAGNIDCNTVPPVTSEVDPQVSNVTNGRVCTGTGSAVDCATLADGSGTCSAGRVCTGGHAHGGLSGCTRISNATAVSLTASSVGYSTATCSSGIVTGGGCYSNSYYITFFRNYPSSTTAWGCGAAYNRGGGHVSDRGASYDTTITAYAICCSTTTN